MAGWCIHSAVLVSALTRNCRFEDVSQLMSTRENVFGILSRQTRLQQAVQASAQELRTLEVETILESSALSRSHGALQSSLKAAMYLSELTEPCKQMGIDIDSTAQLEAANVLWDQGEMTASIGILQNIRRGMTSENTTMHVGPAELLAKLVSYSINLKRILWLTTPCAGSSSIRG